MALNRFGAVYTSVVSLYPGTQTSDFATQAIIEEALDWASDALADALSPEIYGQLTEPEMQIVVRRATSGQTTGTVWLLPMVTGETHVWVGQPSQFVTKPTLYTDYQANQFSDWAGSGTSAIELASTAFSVNASTGVITLVTPMQTDDMLVVSYRVDTASASYSIPSMARLAVRGAAAEMGSRLYTEANQEWALVAAYRKEFEDAIAGFRDNSMVPPEMRAAKFWNEPEPLTSQGGTVRLYRG